MKGSRVSRSLGSMHEEETVVEKPAEDEQMEVDVEVNIGPFSVGAKQMFSVEANSSCRTFLWASFLGQTVK